MKTTIFPSRGKLRKDAFNSDMLCEPDEDDEDDEDDDFSYR